MSRVNLYVSTDDGKQYKRAFGEDKAAADSEAARIVRDGFVWSVTAETIAYPAHRIMQVEVRNFE